LQAVKKKLKRFMQGGKAIKLNAVHAREIDGFASFLLFARLPSPKTTTRVESAERTQVLANFTHPPWIEEEHATEEDNFA
jgi:hypothetical protein